MSVALYRASFRGDLAGVQAALRIGANVLQGTSLVVCILAFLEKRMPAFSSGITKLPVDTARHMYIIVRRSIPSVDFHCLMSDPKAARA